MEKRFPFPTLPTGWFCVGHGKELKPGKILPRRYFGQDLALYRTRRGEARLVDAYCPHLGAHLGHMGRVDGEELRCSFHGFRFDGDGACTGNAYGSKPPPNARLGCWPLREVNGFLLAWYDALGRPPSWEVPAIDHEGWTPALCRSTFLDSHPQETSENSVDFGHFTQVHGFARAWMTQDAQTDGPLLTTSYGVDRKLDFLGLRGRTVRAHFFVEVWGLGWSLVTGEVPAVGVHMRHFVMSTPIDEGRIEMRLATSIRRYGVPLVTRIAHPLVWLGLLHEVSRDAPIWSTKRYVERPALAKGDGPIGVYRRWCRQFYPDAPKLRTLREVS